MDWANNVDDLIARDYRKTKSSYIFFSRNKFNSATNGFLQAMNWATLKLTVVTDGFGS
jgi:hypothetical protein